MATFLSTDVRNCMRCRANPRQGSVYVAVLGVSMILAMVGLAALHVERVNLRATVGRDLMGRAQVAATSAVEFAFARMKADPSWRTTFTNNQDVPISGWSDLGDAKFRFALVDADGSLSDNDNDPVTIRATGAAGDATCVASVIVEPGRPGLTCLDVAIHCGGMLSVDNQSTLTTNEPASSNNRIDINPGILGLLLASRIDGDAWSTGSISGSVTGNKYANSSPAREMPDSSAVFDYYLNVGTRIDINSIPSNKIENVVLSPASNPYGAANAQGIYIIDCKNQTLQIRNARILATLVLVNVGGTPQLSKSINWEPAAPNYPALMVQGNLQMNWDGGVVLSEALQAVNFNPAGTPYSGIADGDKIDTYPGVIKGLIYTTGNVTVDKTCILEGNLVAAGTINVSADSSATYKPTARDYPPPGFGGGTQLRMVPASWRRLPKN